jgi:hypothetical protein
VFLANHRSTIGQKYGFQYAEEFNYVGIAQGLQDHVLGKIKPQ